MTVVPLTPGIRHVKLADTETPTRGTKDMQHADS
jgi:hypothetical protein